MTVPHTSGPLGALDRFRQAWNAADATAFGRLFTEDATYVIYAGDVLRGRPEIEQAHRDLFARGATTMHYAILDTRMVGTDAAVVLTAGGIRSEPVGADPVDYDKFQTLVLTRSNDDWLVAAFHNTSMSDISLRQYRAETSR